MQRTLIGPQPIRGRSRLAIPERIKLSVDRHALGRHPGFGVPAHSLPGTTDDALLKDFR